MGGIVRCQPSRGTDQRGVTAGVTRVECCCRRDRPVRVMAGHSACSTWSASLDSNRIRRICPARSLRGRSGIRLIPRVTRRTSCSSHMPPLHSRQDGSNAGVTPTDIGGRPWSSAGVSLPSARSPVRFGRRAVTHAPWASAGRNCTSAAVRLARRRGSRTRKSDIAPRAAKRGRSALGGRLVSRFSRTFEDASIGHRGPGRQVRQERRLARGLAGLQMRGSCRCRSLQGAAGDRATASDVHHSRTKWWRQLSAIRSCSTSVRLSQSR